MMNCVTCKNVTENGIYTNKYYILSGNIHDTHYFCSETCMHFDMSVNIIKDIINFSINIIDSYILSIKSPKIVLPFVTSGYTDLKIIFNQKINQLKQIAIKEKLDYDLIDEKIKFIYYSIIQLVQLCGLYAKTKNESTLLIILETERELKKILQ